MQHVSESNRQRSASSSSVANVFPLLQVEEYRSSPALKICRWGRQPPEPLLSIGDCGASVDAASGHIHERMLTHATHKPTMQGHVPLVKFGMPFRTTLLSSSGSVLGFTPSIMLVKYCTYLSPHNEASRTNNIESDCKCGTHLRCDGFAILSRVELRASLTRLRACMGVSA